MSFVEELRRRKVLKVGGAYLVLAWLAVQVASIGLPAFEAPAWVLRVFILALMLGFPITVVMAWLLEATPEGLRLEPAPRGNKRVVGASLAVAALAVAWYFVGQPAVRGDTVGAPQGTPATASPRSIAVLPFVDMSQGKDQEYFSDGITEEILNALTRIDGLKVAGRTSSFHFKGRNEDLKAIGAALGVAHVLEGSVRKHGDTVRITAQLVKVDDGFHLWSQTYERRLDNVFAVQDEISAAIAQALSTKLADDDATPGDAGANPKAHDLYLRARQALARRNAADLAEAASLFEAATLLEPDYGKAWSGRAKALSLLWNYGGDPGMRFAAPARIAAERAVAIDPGNAEAHSMLAQLAVTFEWQWDEALRETALAVALAPNDSEVANFAGDIYRLLGDFEQGLHWERRALELDPLFPTNHTDLSWTFLAMNRCREAIAAADRALALDAKRWAAYNVKARSYLCLREYDKVPAPVQAGLDAGMPAYVAVEIRARLAARTGDRAAAAAALAQLQQIAAAGERIDHVIAEVQAETGDLDAAAASLERAYAYRDPNFSNNERLLLPEDWPDHPGIRAALRKPELDALHALRRRNLENLPRAALP